MSLEPPPGAGGRPPGPGGTSEPPPLPPPVCPRHPDRVSYISCQRCDRPTCPDCQRPAAVGIQCADCVGESARSHPQARTRFGGVVRPGATPLVTYTLIGLCGLVFLGQLTDDGVTQELAFIGYLAGQEPWRFLTSAFVHSPTQLLHILFNMYILFAFGPVLEQLLGRGKFLATYLVCAVGGSAGVLLLGEPHPNWMIPVVGASGAIFGLLFLYVVLALHQRRVPTMLLVMIGINLALPVFMDGIAWQAHVGGGVVGALLGGLFILASAPGRSAQADRRRALAWPGLVVVTVLLFAVALWRLYDVVGRYAFSSWL